jgi:hypothetical protein
MVAGLVNALATAPGVPLVGFDVASLDYAPKLGEAIPAGRRVWDRLPRLDVVPRSIDFDRGKR